ncbi:hypothetical protein [Mucilaginibacter lappiensis]|uniref:Uncharacterized protein n=1 Tax=Mucilaginibacter lappiensis TaxID=354630 RepID=A0A841J835_9SPHI|nr:hypothetical protein [Mucilaginibacter lappiensis]MBB6126957.1 hypothetical protein [Mucilaginibacter lappiensis]
MKAYFDKMKPGDTIEIWKAQKPLFLAWGAKEYIAQGGQLEFSNDYEQLKKL